MAGPAPTLEMTLYEIYLEFRTAPIGSVGVRAALFEAASFAGKPLTGSFTAGYAIGTTINKVINTYDPELGAAIGATVAKMVNVVTNNNTAVPSHQAVGQFQLKLDTTFNNVVSPTSYGDYNVTEPMADYVGGGGCVCSRFCEQNCFVETY